MSSTTMSSPSSHEAQALLVAEDHDQVNLGLDDESLATAASSMTRSQAISLYTSHLLSTWNARTYEFSAVR